MKVVVLNTVLEMHDSRQALLEFPEIAGLTVQRAAPQEATDIRSLYREIGENHFWMTRWRWTEDDFSARIGDDTVRIWIARLNGEPAGFAEFYWDEAGSIEIKQLGVAPRFEGRGIGKHLLSFVIREAWKLNPKRVWVLTRSFDGEHALLNYRKRGFEIKKVRPEVMGVAPGQEENAKRVVERAKSRGLHPGFWRRMEGHLRDSPPGDVARRFVYWLRHL